MLLRPLRPGDIVAFVTPASPIAGDKVEFLSAWLKDRGYRVRLMPHALTSGDYLGDYLAGRDEERAADLMEAFDDPSIGAVICTRGGYGCARLFPFLDLDRIVASRKIFVGFSDITTLHAALNRRGMTTVHGPMALTLAYPRAPWVFESLARVLEGDLRAPADAPAGTCMVAGRAEGRVVGGCLNLLTDSLGTPNPLDADGSILLIEEVDQAPHRIDAMLTHLINSGVAARAAGFLIGEMTRADERTDSGIGGAPWRLIVKERLAPLAKPTVIDFPLGHARNMLTLPLGLRARLDAEAGTLTYLETMCE